MGELTVKFDSKRDRYVSARKYSYNSLAQGEIYTIFDKVNYPDENKLDLYLLVVHICPAEVDVMFLSGNQLISFYSDD